MVTALNSMARLWTPAPRMGGAEWADAYRVLGPDESADPGPWRSVGWQRYLLDLMADPTVDWIVILKAAQMGVSELVRCAIGRWALLDPGDVLWVMATQDAATKSMEKLRSMFRNTPALRPLWPTEAKAHGRKRKDSLNEVRLTNGMRIVIGWATSASSLASDPFPRVIMDETGLYPVRVGKEGSPIGLAEERTKTFGRRRKVILLSKPAHPDDLICTSHDACIDRRERHVPCPSCAALQPLEWERVRWLDSEGCVQQAATAPTDPTIRLLLAAHAEQTQAAWVECRACGGRISDVRKADQDERATWLRVDENEGKTSRRRAVHISELYHWSKGVSDLVARYLRASKPADLQNFHTGSLGRPYEQERGEVRAELFAARAVYPAGVIPSWTRAIVAGADTQKDHFWLVVVARGLGGQQRTLDWGRVETFEQLRSRAFALFHFDNSPRDRARAQLLVIDSGGGTAGGALDGSRSREVLEFAATTPGVIASKGKGHQHGALEGSPLEWGKVQLVGGKALRIVRPHANYWLDQLAAEIRSDQWEEPTTAADPEYGRQMTGKRLVYQETTRGAGKWVWLKRAKRPDHLQDARSLAGVAASLVNVDGCPLLLERVHGSAGYGHRGPSGGGYAERTGERWQVGR